MPFVVLVVVLLLVGFLIWKSMQDSGTHPAAGEAAGPDRSAGGTHPSRLRRRGRTPGPGRPEPTPPAPPIDQDALAAHVAKLRAAVAQGLISDDEAAASVVRQTRGGLSDEAARRLLDTDDKAA